MTASTMTSAEVRQTRHVPSSTAMLPPLLRPCCKRKSLLKLGSGIALITFVFCVCLSLQLRELLPDDAKSLWDFGIPNSASFHRNVREASLNTYGGYEDDELGVDFRKLSEDFVVSNKTGANESLTAYFDFRLQRAVLAMKAGIAVYKEEMSRLPCSGSQSEEARAVSRKLGVTLIYSLVGVDSVADAVLFLRNNFRQLPANSVDDVMVTVEEEAEKEYKDRLEDLVDLCEVCRVFYFSGSLWEHRRAAARFAHGDVLVFMDARVHPITDAWLWPLIDAVSRDERLVASPQVHLRGGEHGRDFSVGVTRNEITWGLAVARGHVSLAEISAAVDSMGGDNSRSNISSVRRDVLSLDQTAFAREALAIRKTFLNHLGGFDLVKDATGGEHIVLSLKVLSCGGNIVLCPCAAVVLEIPDVSSPKYALEMAKRQRGQHSRVPPWPSSDSDTRQASETVDFQSPSFLRPLYFPVQYLGAAQDLWFDAYSKKYSGCVVQPYLHTSARVRPRPKASVSVRQRGRPGNMVSRPEPNILVRLRQQINRRKCGSRNFRILAAKRQPAVVSPTRRATFYGYIRSIDGLYAFGVSPAMTAKEIFELANSQNSFLGEETQRRGRVGLGGGGGPVLNLSQTLPNRTDVNNEPEARLHIVLTRNSTEWIGPFSHTNGAFIYQKTLCLTLTPSGRLTLKKCIRSTKDQLFAYTAQTIKPLGLTDQWACAKLPGSRDPTGSAPVSAPVFMAPCVRDKQEEVPIAQFKMDVRFKNNCVT